MDRQFELLLVQRLREGNPAAFDPVYEEYHARLFNFLARLCRQRDIAEDLLEETWLRFVINARRLRPDTRLAPWLSRLRATSTSATAARVRSRNRTWPT
jgi:RNA polymerase sigma-70 factor (ECF subfamily)